MKSSSLRGRRVNEYRGAQTPISSHRDNTLSRFFLAIRYSSPLSNCGRVLSSCFGSVNESPNPTSTSQGLFQANQERHMIKVGTETSVLSCHSGGKHRYSETKLS